MPHYFKPLSCLAVLGALLVTTAPVDAAEVYMWKDAEGNAHYTDQPPPGVESKRIFITAPASSEGSSAAPRKSLADQDLEFRKRQTERSERESKEADEASRREKLARQCAEAERQLKALESGQRIARYNDKGEREFLDDSQRDAEAERIRGQIETHCRK